MDSARRGAEGFGLSRPRATLENARGADPCGEADFFFPRRSRSPLIAGRLRAHVETPSRPAIEGFLGS